jgi:hypothetical protein
MTEDHSGRANSHPDGSKPAPKKVRSSASFLPSSSEADSSFHLSFIDSRGEPTTIPPRRRGRHSRIIAIAVVIGVVALGLYGLIRLLPG